MIVRKLLTVMGYKVDEKSEDQVESSVDKLKSAAKALAAVFATGAIAVAIRKFVEQGSSAAETMNVVSQSFENNTAAVLEWAKVQSVALGRSEFLLREYAATLGAMLRPQLESADAAAEMSTELAQLAVDLGSFFETNEPEVLAAIKSGIIGASEPMRRFGVVMTVASLDAFALAQGLKKTTKEMGETEKLTLRYQFIMAKTAAAQGDAARTAGGFANLTKALRAVLTDLGTEIGLVLLPASERQLQAFVDIARVLKGPIIGAVKRAMRVLGALANTTTVIIVAVTALGIAFTVLGAKAIFAWLAAVAPAVLLVALIGLISAAIFILIDDLETMGEGGESVIGGLISEFQHWLEETGSITQAIGQVLKTAFLFWANLILGLFDTTAEEVEKKFRLMLDRAFMQARRDFTKFVNFMRKFSIFGVLETQRELATKAGTAIGGLLRPAVAAAGFGGGGGPVVVNQRVEVNTTAAPGMNEGELAQQVAADAGRATAAVNRQTANQLAVGGGG